MGKQNILTSSRRKKAEALLNNQQFDEARNLFQQICKLDSHDADAWFMLGITNANLGNLAETVKCNQRAITLRPNFWEAHFNLGKALHNLGHLDEAEAIYKKTVDLNPGLPQALNNLGNLLQDRGKLIEALACYRNALANNPDYATAYVACVNKGSIQLQMGRIHEAETSFLQALKINSSNPVALKYMATTQFALCKYENALHYWQQLEDIHPGQVDISIKKAEILERQGQLDKAYNIIKAMIDQGKKNTEIAMLFASVCRHIGHRNEAITMLERTLSNLDEKINDNDLVSIHYKLGTLYDAEQDYDQAFKHFQTANDLKRIKFDRDSDSAIVDKLIETFNPHFLSNLPRSTNNSERPVFIVGMPRSGTTLVEQILSSHPQIYGAGELGYLRMAIPKLPKLESQKTYPDNLAELTQETYDQIAQSYLDFLMQSSTEERYVINKMPGYFLHLGFIAILFPKARIIHCMRDPLDTCLSCYFSDFIGSSNSFAHRLEDLGYHYRNYDRLMQHWNAVLDIPILNVSYEELITDQEDVTHRLLDFFELEWDEACLRFFENKRIVNTMSYNQVRQPIYTRSIGRWKHYERYLEPLKTSLLDSLPEQN